MSAMKRGFEYFLAQGYHKNVISVSEVVMNDAIIIFINRWLYYGLHTIQGR